MAGLKTIRDLIAASLQGRSSSQTDPYMVDEGDVELARRRACEVGRAVIELRGLVEDDSIDWPVLDAKVDELSTAARAIGFCAYRATYPSAVD